MTKKAMVDYFVTRLATAKDETFYDEGKTYACAVLGQKLFRLTRGGFFWYVNETKKRAEEKLQSITDEKPREFIKGMRDVCSYVLRRTRTWEGKP